MKYFKKICVVTGYKSSLVKNHLKENKKISFIYNRKFRYTNMVESIFAAKKKIQDDVVIVYSDIIFDLKIINLLKEKKNIMPVNLSWKKIWRLRMPFKKIIYDAENITIDKNKKLISIGGKLKQKLPKYQFMGIIKILKKDFHKLFFFTRN